ncbi:MAG: DUF2285 domain-containing protein [Rhizomicrobium sp.]
MPAEAGESPVAAIRLWGPCPWSDALSDYDRRHIAIYARLLHDESEGASEAELAQEIFRIDPRANRDRMQRVVRSHLQRAHWIADTLFPMLDW